MLRKCDLQSLWAHSTLVIHRHRHGRLGAEPEEAQSAIDGHMALPTDEDADTRSAAEPVALDIPTCPLEHGVPSSSEARDMCHLTAGHEGKRGRRGEPEKLLEPLAGDLLDDGSCGPADDEAGVLIPGARQPVRRERGGQRAADDEPEVAAARNRDHPSVGRSGKRFDHGQRIDRYGRQRAADLST